MFTNDTGKNGQNLNHLQPKVGWNRNFIASFAEHKKVEEEVDKLDPEIFKKLKNYKSVSYFKKAAMNMLVKMSSEGEIKEMKKVF